MIRKLVRKVQPGQVWVSLDPRERGRQVVVLGLTDSSAVVASTTSSRITQIRLDRLVPGSRGFLFAGRVGRSGEKVS